MAMEIYITTVDPEKVSSLETEDGEILDTLGPQEEAIAIKLQELLSSVTDAIKDRLEAESQLKIEITGSVSIKAQGGFKCLIFNTGAEASKTGTMKVSLSTTLKPNGVPDQAD